MSIEAGSTVPDLGPFATSRNLRERLVDAVMSQSGLRHRGLETAIRQGLSSLDVDSGALLRDPVIEGAAGYVGCGTTFSQLAGSLIHPRLFDALSRGPEDRPYRFPGDAEPYQHQVEAWRHLSAPQHKSVLVSSGTGSGKTECFLIPLLNDLAHEVDREGPLTGVRAIALYPLNALIASQQERLRAWTDPFGRQIRFGLYNGLMKEDVKEEEERSVPNQVVCRRTLRKDPPPILVTNVTMLEYMTIRRQDRPILQKSRGKLRWIILDEAHSYVGSAAAEVALLIRRVLHAFNVTPDQVRFVATSATIGEGKDVTDELRRFLRDISGAKIDNVELVQGHREKVTTGPQHARELGIAETDLGRFVEAVQDRAVTLPAAAKMLRVPAQELSELLEGLAGRGRAAPVLPLRLHSFLRSIPGIWSCFNSDCIASRPPHWPFGSLHFEFADQCSHCKAPVFELVSCVECGEPFLDALEVEGQLVPISRPAPDDEFADSSETESVPDDDDDGMADDDAYDLTPAEFPRLIACRALEGLRPVTVDSASGRVMSRPSDPGSLIFLTNWGDVRHCKCCSAGPNRDRASPFRPFRFGAPFLIGNAAPIMVSGTPEAALAVGQRPPPANGRQVLSFTDSRQGTARFAATIQTNSERGFVRGFIYHTVQRSMAPSLGAADLAELLREAQELEEVARDRPSLSNLAEKARAKYEKEAGGSVDGIPWSTVRDTLAADPTTHTWISEVWGRRDTRFNDESDLATFLLLRETARRPRKANSVETLGLAWLRFEAIDCLTEASLPDTLRDRGRNIDDWKQFLYVLLDQTARGYFALQISSYDMDWLVPNRRNQSLLPPGQASTGREQKTWPMARNRGPKPTAVLLLETALQLDARRQEDREKINDVLDQAWRTLEPLFRGPSARYALDLKHGHLAPVKNAWRCPVTGRVLPYLAFGMTPYGHREGLAFASAAPAALEFPELPITFPQNSAETETVAEWLRSNEARARLRAERIWTDLTDRAALMSPYLRAAEHSAQQPPARLRRFEAEFKRGEINVLNCSTTMEMGVDIGSITSVMMTNVPPSVANYRQRVGRAGRRRQGIAMSLTLTRDGPLEKEAFRSPELYLGRTIRAPKVVLDSVRIVQRHVNAMLLAQWFADSGGQLTKAKTGDFFGCAPDLDSHRAGSPPVELFLNWLGKPETETVCRPGLNRLVAGTALEDEGNLYERAAERIREIYSAFVNEWSALQAQARELDRDVARKSIGFQLVRLCRENLLKELAVRSYLPGHGFPTNVVPFVNRDKPDADEVSGVEGADDGDGRYRSFPSRNLDIAIRDYAPGSEVVVDGLVYRSAGVTLNWTRPPTIEATREIQNIKNFWKCEECGAADVARSEVGTCPDCSAPNPVHRRFLEPVGFTVDMTRMPHADTDKVVYVEPEPERVVARNGDWATFINNDIGRARTSFDGLVFYASAGAKRNGYSVCLDCGRAEAIRSPGDLPLVGHRPLRFTKAGADGTCPGNTRSFAILDAIDLGHDIVTDVVEFQPTRIGRGSGWALAAALREALAQSLGIEAREMGLSVELASAASTYSILLYDRNAGGAGFAPKLLDDPLSLIRKAKTLLQCSNPGCIKGCSNCVMAADIQAQHALMDRTAALNVIQTWSLP